MRRFNASKVKALGNLATTSEKQKRFMRRARGVKQRFAEDKPDPAFQASRDYVCPMKAGWTPKRKGPRLGEAGRAAVAHKTAQREAFFASLCAPE